MLRVLFIYSFIVLQSILIACDKDEISPYIDSHYTMLDVKGVGDMHLIKTENNKLILIDVGNAESVNSVLIPYLKKRGVDKIDYIFISHAHRDHYGGLLGLIESQVDINTIFFNLPNEMDCFREDHGCSFYEIEEILKACEKKSINLTSVEKDYELKLAKDTRIKVLYAFNNETNPLLLPLDLNDQSIILRYEYQNFSILFTGDLNLPLGKYLAETSNDLKADILKVPHHGGRGIAPNEFFNKVSPSYLMIPAPAWLWCSENSDQVRQWSEQKELPVYINGFNGNVYVDFEEEKISIYSDILTSTFNCD